MADHAGPEGSMPAGPPAAAPPGRRTVLVVDDAAVLAALVQAALRDEGYTVAVLTTLTSAAIRTAVGRLEPDCLLLDSRGPTDYGDSWRDAAWAHARARAVPVVMFTASLAIQQEAQVGASARSRAAGLFAVLGKPFDLDELLATVARAVGSVAPFDRAGGGRPAHGGPRGGPGGGRRARRRGRHAPRVGGLQPRRPARPGLLVAARRRVLRAAGARGGRGDAPDRALPRSGRRGGPRHGALTAPAIPRATHPTAEAVATGQEQQPGIWAAAGGVPGRGKGQGAPYR
jgi:CheY-like chemotaxis protein